jgi:cytochrome c-type biogenesis protein
MNESVTFAAAFAAGLLSFLSPCVLPLVPAYLGFITGMGLDEMRETPSRWAVVVPALFFVGGFSFVFLLMGASASLLGAMLTQYQSWIARIGGVLIVVFGLHLLGVFRLTPLMRERRFQLSNSPKGYFGATVVGIVFAAGWTPCIGPVLGALWTLAAYRDTMYGALLLLGGYSLGLAVPFLLAALATGSFLGASKRIRRAIPVLEKVSGAVLVVVGLLLVTGSFTILAAYFARLTPDFILRRI